jgi:acyl-coenzyme A thioesterase PaaI-like protein
VSALADNAMGLSCGLALDGGGLLTVNLAIDFLSLAKIGQWLQVEPTVVKRGKSLCFASALVTADGKPCARASATFQVVS